MKIFVKKTSFDGMIPKTPNVGDAGIDLPTPAPFDLYKGQDIKVDLNLAFEIPPGHVGIIKDRSSMGAKGIKVLGGVIDSSYRGNVSVCLKNLGNGVHKFNRGDRIAQMIIIPIPEVEVVEATELSETKRATGAFGSTGV